MLNSKDVRPWSQETYRLRLKNVQNISSKCFFFKIMKPVSTKYMETRIITFTKQKICNTCIGLDVSLQISFVLIFKKLRKKYFTFFHSATSKFYQHVT